MNLSNQKLSIPSSENKKAIKFERYVSIRQLSERLSEGLIA
jgi:hypothetical protein